MPQTDRITPTPGYRPREIFQRIRPRSDFKPSSLHTRALPAGSVIRSVEAEWCPVCLGRKISERMVSGRPMWHCDECRHEW
jgi:hypothetical protein